MLNKKICNFFIFMLCTSFLFSLFSLRAFADTSTDFDLSFTPDFSDFPELAEDTANYSYGYVNYIFPFYVYTSDGVLVSESQPSQIIVRYGKGKSGVNYSQGMLALKIPQSVTINGNTYSRSILKYSQAFISPTGTEGSLPDRYNKMFYQLYIPTAEEISSDDYYTLNKGSTSTYYDSTNKTTSRLIFRPYAGSTSESQYFFTQTLILGFNSSSADDYNLLNESGEAYSHYYNLMYNNEYILRQKTLAEITDGTQGEYYNYGLIFLLNKHWNEFQVTPMWFDKTEDYTQDLNTPVNFSFTLPYTYEEITTTQILDKIDKVNVQLDKIYNELHGQGGLFVEETEKMNDLSTRYDKANEILSSVQKPTEKDFDDIFSIIDTQFNSDYSKNVNDFFGVIWANAYLSLFSIIPIAFGVIKLVLVGSRE